MNVNTYPISVKFESLPSPQYFKIDKIMTFYAKHAKKGRCFLITVKYNETRCSFNTDVI